MTATRVEAELEHLFRKESGRITAMLARLFGPDHIDLAESVVQEALLRAVETWPLKGIPENPSAWIMQVARNCALDKLRQEKFICRDPITLDQLEKLPGQNRPLDPLFENELRDNQLRLIFICCHPALPREARVALTLKTLCGFSVAEIARAFLSKEETIAQRLVRAKAKISELKLPFEVPAPEELPQRMDSVLESLYLLFNEGYLAYSGDDLVREDLCHEAIRLMLLLVAHPCGQLPKARALLALMSFQASRLKARVDNAGDVLLLEDQDRTLWNQELISQGLYFLHLSAEGEDLSEYHIQAGIAATHAVAENFEATDWNRVLEYYDAYMLLVHSPLVALNRAVAVAMVHGPQKGLDEISTIKDLPPLKSYYLLPATIGELHRKLGHLQEAATHYKAALKLVGTEPEKRLILKRLSQCFN